MKKEEEIAMKSLERTMTSLMVVLLGVLFLTLPIIGGHAFGAVSDNFSTDSVIWTYKGMAYRDTVNEYVILTNSANWQWGQIWLNESIKEPFIVKFLYLAGGGSGADGLVFMFYKKSNYVPDYGGSIGFSAAPHASLNPVPGYGIEFDNYPNGGGYNDPPANHIALIKDHPGNHLASVDDHRTEDFQWHSVEVIVEESTIVAYVDGYQVLNWSGNIDRTYGGLGFSAATGVANNWHIIDDVSIEMLTIPVAIDIKPNSFPNSINLKSKGNIPVAILTTDIFDATTVDETTVLFGATGTEAALVHSDIEDVDGDLDTDMILHFNTQDTDILCGDTSAFLTGETFGGQAIEGSDSIKTVGCK